MRLGLISIVAVAFGVAVVVAPAGGRVEDRVVTLRPGDVASFGGVWRCGYAKTTFIHCGVGDQTPDVELRNPQGPLVVKVTASVGYTRVTKVRHHVCADPGRCRYEDTYIFSGGAGG